MDLSLRELGLLMLQEKAEVMKLCARKLLSGWSLVYIRVWEDPVSLCILLSSTGAIRPCNSTQRNC